MTVSRDFFILANKKNTKFFGEGAGNDEFDGPFITDAVEQAKFITEKRAEQILSYPKTKAYWGDAEISKFLKTAVVKRVVVTIFESGCRNET